MLEKTKYCIRLNVIYCYRTYNIGGKKTNFHLKITLMYPNDQCNLYRNFRPELLHVSYKTIQIHIHIQIFYGGTAKKYYILHYVVLTFRVANFELGGESFM
jgi:hypothetical protein